jgi:hypothetical protein
VNIRCERDNGKHEFRSPHITWQRKEVVQSIIHQRLASTNTMVNTIVGSWEKLDVVQMINEFTTSKVVRWTDLMTEWTNGFSCVIIPIHSMLNVRLHLSDG